jgi:hypothetical protein
MIQQNVIDMVSKKVKRYGHCNFRDDGSFDEVNEDIIEMEWVFSPDISERNWYWNGVSFQPYPL